MGRGSFLLRLTVLLLVVALNRPSQRFILDEVGHSYIGVATANFGATVREKESSESPGLQHLKQKLPHSSIGKKRKNIKIHTDGCSFDSSLRASRVLSRGWGHQQCANGDCLPF